jgi:prepilin-type N-terminal cleavage/methylation domain-containing protein
MSKHNHKIKTKRQSGFTLIECLVAMVITTIGLLAVVGLITVGIRLQSESRDAISANSLAKAKLEELQNYAPTATQRARGGSLTNNTANYNDSPDPRYQRRWLIETYPTDAGVPANTQRITVVMVANTPDVRLPDIRIVVLVPSS